MRQCLLETVALTIDHIPDEVIRDVGATAAAEDRALLDMLKDHLRRDLGKDPADDR